MKAHRPFAQDAAAVASRFFERTNVETALKDAFAGNDEEARSRLFTASHRRRNLPVLISLEDGLSVADRARCANQLVGAMRADPTSNEGFSLGNATGGRASNLAMLQALGTTGAVNPKVLGELTKNLDGGAIEVAPQHEPFEPPDGWVVMTPDVTASIVLAREVYILNRLVPPLSGEFSAEAQNEHIGRSLAAAFQAAHEEPGEHPLVRECQRLSAQPHRHLSAYLDPSSGRVVISRARAPLPPSIRISPAENRDLMHELFDSRLSADGTEALVSFLERKLPTDMLVAAQTVSMNGLRIWPDSDWLSSEREIAASRTSTRASAGYAASMAGFVFGGPDWLVLAAAGLMGLKATALILPHHPLVRALGRGKTNKEAPEPETLGHVQEQTGTLEVGSRRLSLDGVASVIGHELMHVLDYALGQAGRLSESKEWRDIWDATVENDRAERQPGFITDYSRTSAGEFFAECGATFLNLKSNEASDALPSLTRGDLKRTNPAAYAFMERLFAQLLPEAIEKGTLTPAKEWVSGFKTEQEQAQADPDSREALVSSALALARQAIEEGRPELLESAQADLERSRNTPRQKAARGNVRGLVRDLQHGWMLDRLDAQLRAASEQLRAET